jgi:3-methyladenine DNA glycosylase Mpg
MRIERGVYQLTGVGEQALELYKDILADVLVSRGRSIHTETNIVNVEAEIATNDENSKPSNYIKK